MISLVYRYKKKYIIAYSRMRKIRKCYKVGFVHTVDFNFQIVNIANVYRHIFHKQYYKRSRNQSVPYKIRGVPWFDSVTGLGQRKSKEY